MSTKAVLEALAAGAGRQSAIGGLMFQDAQKREAQGYELALQKEKWRRSGETSALENAMKGYKANWESYTKTFNKLNEIYWRAKSGQATEGYDIATTDLTELNDERLKYWDLSQHSKKKFLEYSGITYEYESMPGGSGGGAETGTGEKDPLVVASAEELGQKELSIIKNKKNMGSVIDERVESANKMLVAEGVKKLKAEGQNTENYSKEQLLAKFGMNPEQEKKFRKEMMAELMPRAGRASQRQSLEEGSYPQAETPSTFPSTEGGRATTAYGTAGFPGPQESLGFDEHISDLIWKGNVDAAGEPIGIDDPDFIKKAEERARKADQLGSVGRTLKGEGYQKTMQQGKISEADFARAYMEAQQALTQIMTQTGRITQQQFIELIQQNEVKGIELRAYQKAFQDILKNRPDPRKDPRLKDKYGL